MSEIEFKPTKVQKLRADQTARRSASGIVDRLGLSSIMASPVNETQNDVRSDADAFRKALTGTAPWEMDGLPVLRIETAEQFKALASPVRDQIINVVANLTTWNQDGTAVGISIRQIGDELGRKPASLYRHIEALVDAGLIDETGSQVSGGRDATTYAAPGAHMVLIAPTEEGPVLDAMCEYIMSAAVNAGREAAAAATDRVTKLNEIGPHDTGGAVIRGWLDEEQRARIRQLQKEMNAVFAECKRRPGTRLMAATLLFRPTRLPDGSIADQEDIATPEG
jgi:DNA-binding transcriptional ArsR family regulator